MDYLDAAIDAARCAGRVHAKYFRSGIGYQTKSSSYDLLTRADIEAEEAVVSLIREHFPGHNVLAEEASYEKTSSGYTWIIDPLDGTNNFACGMPIFCVSLALACGDEVILGVVYDVSRDELFTVQKDKGAFLNGEPLSVSRVKTLQEALLITGFYYDRGESMKETLDNIRLFFQRRIMGLRRLGAAALDLCYIASGRASGFWEFELSPWDFAAGMLMVREAGGTVTGKKGEAVSIWDKSYIVASNTLVHEQMLSVLQ